MAAVASCFLAGRGTSGFFVADGRPPFSLFPRDDSKEVRAFAFNKLGTILAYSDGQKIRLISCPDCNLQHELDCPKVSGLQFSSLGTVLASWELYVGKKDAPQESCNLRIWDVATGKCLKALHQKRQIGWEPQWSSDEKIVGRNVNNEVHFYENNDFGAIVKKIFVQKVSTFSLSSGPAPYHVACYVPGTKGQPSNVKLYQYPKFEGNSAVIGSKSFFKADKVDMKWNEKGTAVLVLTSMDADKSGSSYYGEQKLHLMLTNGESSFVELLKNGPVYSVEWSPLSTEFCVVYGYMPAKATLYNFKGEVAFDFGTNPRNLVYYNAFGNILTLAGFGNLNGHIEIWDLMKKKEICRVQARDTTYFEWCPDGEHFLTATLSPRLRVGNGYKIWHYSGSLLHEYCSARDTEMWQINWMPAKPGAFQERKINYSSVPGVEPSTPAASKEAYRPPAARGLPNTFKLHDDYELPSNLKKPVDQASLSKAAQKNKKKRDAKKKKEAESKQSEISTDESSNPVRTEQTSLPIASDPETEKKLKNLLKKMDQIQKLKDLQASGKALELNQLEKIKKEAELVKEIEDLQLQ